MTVDVERYVKVRPGEPMGTYSVSPPELNEVERLVLSVLREVLSGRKSLNDFDLSPLGPYTEDFKVLVRDFVRSLPPRRLLPPTDLLKLSEELLEDLHVVGIKEPYVAIKPIFDSFGFSDLTFPLLDESIEEMMVNGDRGIFVYHVDHGHMEFRGDVDVEGIVVRLRKQTSSREPIFDLHLPSGERVNVVLPPHSPGPSVTIRKFSRRFYNLATLVRTRTLSSEAAAYLWLLLEGWGVSPHNLIVAGNTGGGKTTTLNALVDLVPLSQRIITIEDTRELSLIHPNWVSLSGEDLDALLRASLRMRPDRIVVGEVRGREAETLLAAMNVGHSGMGTLHANSARDAIRRLTTPPMEVPPSMLPVLNLLVLQHRIHIPGKGVVRRVVQVVEVLPSEGGVSLSEVFRWDPKRDELKRTSVPFALFDGLAEALGVTKKEVLNEWKRRTRIIDFAVRERMDRPRFVSLVNTYYLHPEKVLGVVE